MTPRLLTPLSFLLYCCLSVFAKTHLQYEGDILLGSLFPIHKQNHLHKGDPCGDIQSEDGIQPLEAMLFTLDNINEDESILKGVRLGAVAYDSCDDPIFASEQAVPFLEGFMSRKYEVESCEAPSSGRPRNTSRDDPPWSSDLVVGMIGPQTSAVSVQLANLGRIFKVPQISYLSTSDKLCNAAEFPYFFRTVPSDVHQAKAIAELFAEFKWNYASVVHSDSEYGEMGYQALKDQFDSKGICLAKPLVIINKYFVAEDYRGIIRSLMDMKLSRIVIVFCDRIPAGRLLEAVKELGVFDRFLWVGSDAWASRESVVKGRESAVLGAVAVQPLRRSYPGFDDYFRSLFESNERNPWFPEYLRVYHNCSSYEVCSQKEDLLIEEQQLYVHFVRDAVYAFAYALDALIMDSCGPPRGGNRLCPQFWKASRDELRSYLENVTFKDIGGNDFSFYGSHEHSLKESSSFFFRHDGPPRYTIINFQERGDSYDWYKIGTYINGKILLNSEIVNFTQHPVTSCTRKSCRPYEIRVPSSSDGCCWTCKQCSINEFRKSEYECGLCPLGEISSVGDNFTTCSLVPEIFMDFRDKWAIASMSFASVGISMTLMTSFIFWKYWETPVVKASGRELSLLLLLGTFLSFSATFVIVAKPSKVTCGTMRFCIGFCYTVCYAAVVTKTNRVARIFRMDNSNSSNNNNPRWTSPLSSLLIAGALVSVEVLINIVWLLLEPPEAVVVVSLMGKRILVCAGVDDNFMAGLVYPFILILGATLYAFKTRKCPGGFNETRYIFFANAVTTIHWFAYVPLYLVSADPHIRAVILALSLCLSAIVQLGCLLFPKLYTVLFKPEKNTRDAVMTSHHNRRFPSNIHPNGSNNNFRSSSFLFEYSRGGGSTLEMSHSSFEAMTGNEHRHLTWSHTLSAVEENNLQSSLATPASRVKPTRIRSTSISRSTQTASSLDVSKKAISFFVNISDEDDLVYEEDCRD
ncbi:Metabotropic glutamate receptor [Caligus rogercresseyi]|uniref:Metabotropic glutamate receptor n=1 Tax=Caligus rogercresseyi TaxID=217165 RepID=A0A109UNN3_CALRO|nr:metabotropic glutamate receptor [Caligus rogercresseyi]QQP57591.1 Metabotropic glutamate receptor [Caligus rogercresseyi]